MAPDAEDGGRTPTGEFHGPDEPDELAESVTVLVGAVRELTRAARVEADLMTGTADPPITAAAGEAAPASAPAVFEVADDDGPLVELRVWGATRERLRRVLPDAASLLAVAAARGRRAPLERAWVGRLGHDLKTPLTAVLGFAGLLGGGGVAAVSPEMVHAAGRVTESGERLLADLEEDLTRWRR